MLLGQKPIRPQQHHHCSPKDATNAIWSGIKLDLKAFQCELKLFHGVSKLNLVLVIILIPDCFKDITFVPLRKL